VDDQQSKIPHHSTKQHQDGRICKEQIKNNDKISNYNISNQDNTLCQNRYYQKNRYTDPTLQNTITKSGKRNTTSNTVTKGTKTRNGNS
jgi:hypothetical protein